MVKHFLWKDVICRLIGTEGGICYLATPHGSTFKMGFYFMVSDKEDLHGKTRQSAIELIRDARAKGLKGYIKPIYN